MERFLDFQEMNSDLKALIWFGSFLLIAILVRLILSATLLRLVRFTKTDIDDRIIHVCRGPIAATLILIGGIIAIGVSSLPPGAILTTERMLRTVIILIWSITGLHIGSMLIEYMGRHDDPQSFFKPRIQPIMQMLLKVFIFGAATYFAFKAWQADISGWLASAGIIGIAVGFAAKDTLANLFSGVFIMADSPYQIGDYIVLDGGIRGRVTQIGLRSTRILTRDDVEVIVPNAIIGNTTIVNQSGGPNEKFRVRVDVSVAYGSDIDLVRERLMAIALAEPKVEHEPEPRVRFRRLGDSGLEYQLLIWVAKPELRGQVMDIILTAICKDFRQHAIEIPYPKRDVYLHQVPANPDEVP